MKKLILFAQCALSLLSINITAMENDYSYHQATTEHAQKIVNVINNHAVNDHTKIVILPEKFRETAIKNDIAQKRLYCATNKLNEVVAFKKLFIINNETEFNNIATDEIRCTNNNRCIESAFFTPDLHRYPASSDLKDSLIRSFSFKNSAIIYFGGDYTVPVYRNQKINSQLIRHAFDLIKKETIDTIQKNNFTKIVLLYGLTKANAGENNGIDRTPSIVRAFKNFAQQIRYATLNDLTNELQLVSHHRYHAFMPTFDPASTECVPLPDHNSIPGYGNVLIFDLEQ